MTPLSILHVCPRPSFSGLEAYALDMATGQRELGHHVSFVVLLQSPLEELCAERGIPAIGITKTFTGRLKFTRWLIALFRGATPPDVIHLHSTQDLDLFWPALLVAKPKRTRVVLQTHIWISHSKRDPLHALTYSLVDEVWCSSNPAKATLSAFLPLRAEKIRVMNYGRNCAQMEADFLSRDEARVQLGIPLDATVVGTVARIDPGKGTREFIEATLKCMRQDAKLHLVSIGNATSDDPKAVTYAAELEDQIAQLPPDLRARVHAPGAVPKSYRLLKSFDLFVLATYKECFALSLLEAQLAALPALATASGGSPEVVINAKTGWLFAPRSVESLHHTLETAIAERSRWAAYGDAARARVRQDFDFPKLLPLTLQAYREILSRS